MLFFQEYCDFVLTHNLDEWRHVLSQNLDLDECSESKLSSKTLLKLKPQVTFEGYQMIKAIDQDDIQKLCSWILLSQKNQKNWTWNQFIKNLFPYQKWFYTEISVRLKQKKRNNSTEQRITKKYFGRQQNWTEESIVSEMHKQTCRHLHQGSNGSVSRASLLLPVYLIFGKKEIRDRSSTDSQNKLSRATHKMKEKNWDRYYHSIISLALMKVQKINGKHD